MKVYIVVQEAVHEELVHHGIFMSLDRAIADANEVAEYAGLELVTNWVWTNDEEDMEIRIEEHDVIE